MDATKFYARFDRSARILALAAVLVLAALPGGPARAAATDLAGVGPVPASFVAAGFDYDGNATLGTALRGFAGAQWQPLGWLRILGGVRLTAREAWPWQTGSGDGGWTVYSDAQFAELIFQTTDDRTLTGGLRILRNAYPGTAASYLSLVPTNSLDLGWFYLRGGLALRWLLDGQSDAARQFEVQTLFQLGFRVFLGDPGCYLRLEANTGNDFETTSLQALGYELAFAFPLAPGWQAQIDASLRPAGGMAFSAAANRVIIGGAVRMKL